MCEMISLRKAFLAIAHPTTKFDYKHSEQAYYTLSKTTKWKIQNISASNCLETTLNSNGF